MGDEEGSTGGSLGRQGGGRGRGHKRKASREAVPLGNNSAARTGDEVVPPGVPPLRMEECDSDDFSACRNLAATDVGLSTAILRETPCDSVCSCKAVTSEAL